MAKDNLTVATPVKQKEEEVLVDVFIPAPEEADNGMKVDMYEHVTINDETTLIRRGMHQRVTVPVFIQLRNKYPNI